MSDCGAPVFENIDELLTEKITRHSREHSDGSVTPSDTSPPSTPQESRSSRKPLLLGLAVIICMLFLLYRMSVRSSVK